MELPETGREQEDVLAEMAALAEDDADRASGRTWSPVNHVDDERERFVDETHAMFSGTSGTLDLDPYEAIRTPRRAA